MGLDKTSDLIKKNLNNYKELESVYRKDKKRFKKAINSLHGKVDNKVIEVWYNRLNFETETTFTINCSFFGLAEIIDMSSLPIDSIGLNTIKNKLFNKELV